MTTTSDFKTMQQYIDQAQSLFDDYPTDNPGTDPKMQTIRLALRMFLRIEAGMDTEALDTFMAQLCEAQQESDNAWFKKGFDEGIKYGRKYPR